MKTYEETAREIEEEKTKISEESEEMRCQQKMKRGCKMERKNAISPEDFLVNEIVGLHTNNRAMITLLNEIGKKLCYDRGRYCAIIATIQKEMKKRD